MGVKASFTWHAVARTVGFMDEVGAPFNDPAEFWPLVRQAREDANMGPVQFARELGTTHQRLGRLEEGNEGRPWKPAARRAFAIAAAEALGCPRSALGLSSLPEATEIDVVLERLGKLEHQHAKLRADVDVVQLDLADSRKRQGIPEHAEEGTGG